MKLSDFDYDLPPDRIAQQPCPVRDQSRLMVLNRRRGAIEHRRFRDLPDLLSPDDLVVLNDSRVIPARLFGRPSGRAGRVEVLLLRPEGERVWQALLRPGKKARPGDHLVFEEGVLEADVLPGPPRAARLLRFDWRGNFDELLERLGEAPLPPYIRRPQGSSGGDSRRYQTVFARRPGSVAAPTAGLHFTPELLERLKTCTVTLHVGYGTFQPIQSEELDLHKMEPERFSVSEESARRINRQRNSGGRIIAVGSTTVRVLEHLMGRHGAIQAGCAETDLFIRPGFRFQLVGGMVTNFHLPRSTLLLLVSALAGQGNIQRCYREAIEK
ncbi:MAG: tRNA preQ1(34) S-adenosylmethionine ribosyltransferase-isomerase QueA, partial [Acidobacteriota bacterium]